MFQTTNQGLNQKELGSIYMLKIIFTNTNGNETNNWDMYLLEKGNETHDAHLLLTVQ